MSEPTFNTQAALADYQRVYDQAHPPEKQAIVGRVLRFTGEYGLYLANPATWGIAATRFAIHHRANSQCVAEALWRSDVRMKQLLVQQFTGLSIEMIFPVLREIAKEVAIYVGGGAVVGGGVGALFGGIGALPGAAIGAKAGFWLMTLLGVGKLLTYVATDALPQMVDSYTQGFSKAWHAGELPPTETAKRAQLMYSATEDFARGHVKLLIAVLTAIVVYLSKGQLKTLVAELNASKLGPKFAQWIEANQAKLVTHPALQPQKSLGQTMREAEEQAAARGSRAAPERAGKPEKLTPGTPEHKAVRWEEYQQKGGKWDYTRWSRQYDTNMRNYLHGSRTETAYREAMQATEGKIKTEYTMRQVDLLKTDDFYAGQLKTGPVSLTKENVLAIKKDGWLVKEGWTVEHILEQGASKPYLDALERSGIEYTIGPKY